MQYLIDGHNLIAKMPDISLSDPDDEVQLVLRLRSWTAVSRKRLITVYFDGGIPGGKNVRLSTPQVRVVFASDGFKADGLLIRHINKVKNAAEYTLISSDHEILRAATARKMPQMRSEAFSLLLGKQWQESPPGPTLSDDDPVISDAEVQEWLATFGPVDHEALSSRPKPLAPNAPERLKPEAEEEAAESYVPASSNREDPDMSQTELGEWLTLFEQAPKPEKKSEPLSDQKPSARPKTRKKAPNPQALDREDLAAWQAFLGQDE